MENNIHAGIRVLYKQGNSNWMIGNIVSGNAEVNTSGVYIPIKPKDCSGVVYVEINQIYTDAKPLDDWMTSTLLTKEDYLNVLQDEDFHKSTEAAWFSDGEYYYYPVSKFNETWIMKQPFKYILRSY